MSEFKTYFYTRFPGELFSYWQEHKDPVGEGVLTHAGAVVIEVTDGEDRYLLADKDDRFRFCWYAAAFLDWGLRACYPERFEEWLKETGGSPYPVRLDNGEVQRLEPYRILDEREIAVDSWRQFCDQYFAEVWDFLKSILGIEPRDFFETVLNSGDFDFTDNLFDEVLAEAAVREYGIEGVFEGI